jgi:hypothetical protein
MEIPGIIGSPFAAPTTIVQGKPARSTPAKTPLCAARACQPPGVFRIYSAPQQFGKLGLDLEKCQAGRVPLLELLPAP